MAKNNSLRKPLKFSINTTTEPPEDWNTHMLKSKLGNIYNTKEYSEYASKWFDWNPIYFRIVDNQGNISLQNLLFEYTPKNEKIPKFLHGLTKKFRTTIRWNYGPISESAESISIFMNYVKNLKKRIHGSTHPLMQIHKLELKKKKWSTFLINLDKSKQELYENLSKKNARKNIERSIRRGVTVEDINQKNMDEYFELLNQTRLSSGITGEIEEFYDLWNNLGKLGFSGFLARKDGIPIGGLTFSSYNYYINEWGVARSQKDTAQKLYAQDLIKWKIIEWGLKNKMKWYDLSGINPNPKSKKEEGILQYKKKWGGIQKDYWIILR